MKVQASQKSTFAGKDPSRAGVARLTEFGGLLSIFILAVSIWHSIPRLTGQTVTPDFEEIQKLFMHASEAEKAGDLEGATKDLQEILRRRPELAEIHNKLGFIYFVQGQYPEAVQAFGNALQLKPESFPSNLGLGMALFRQSAFEEAVPPLKKACVLNPTDPQAVFFLGSSFLSLERF